MADEISIIVRAEDAFSSVLGDFGNVMTGIKSTIDLVSGAFQFAADAIQPFIDSASEAEVSSVALQTVWSSMAGTFDLSVDQLSSLATEMQNLSGYSDEAEQSAEAMLLRFENLGSDIFPEALKLTNDLARSLGIDLTTAARQIGMALDDPASGIGRLNTQFRLFNETEMTTIKQMAENGDIAGAQALIMDRLREKVGGAADAYGNTFAGSLDIAREKLDNIRELIGGPVIVLLGDLLAQLMNFAETNPTIQAILNFFAKFNEFLSFDDVPFISALGAALLTLENLNPAFYDLGQALLIFQGYLNTGHSALEAFKGALDELDARTADDSFIGKIVAQIQDFISTGESQGWGDAIRGVFDNIMAALDLNTRIQTMLDALSNQIIAWTETGQADALATGLGNFLTNAVQVAFNNLDETIGQVDFAPIVSALGNALWEAIKSIFSGIGNAFWDTFAQVVFSDSNVNDFWASVDIGADRLLAILLPVSSISTLTGMFRNLGYNIIQGLWNGWNSALNALGLGDMAAWWQQHIVQPIFDFLGISSPSTLFASIGKNVIEGFVNGISSLIDWAKGKVIGYLQVMLAPFLGLLEFLGIDTSGIFGSGTGSTGGGTTGGGPANSGTGGSTGTDNLVSGTVNNYYYGPVYFGAAGEPGAYYDCPSPNPLMTAGSGTLVTNPT